MKFWLQPIARARNDGLPASELRDIERLVERHCDALLAAYIAFMPADITARRCWIEDRRVCLELADQRVVSFPAAKYPRLADAPQELLQRAALRLHGRALRWEELDEDILVDDAVHGRFPRPQPVVA